MSAGERPADVVAACFEAFGRRDSERFVELVTEDVRWQPASSLLAPRSRSPSSYHGHEGIRSWFADASTWIGYTVQTLDPQVAGEKVFVPAVATLAGETDWLTRAVFFVFTVRDGRVAELATWEREDDARAAAGLPPVNASLAPDAAGTGSLQVPASASRLGEIRTTLRDVASAAGLDEGATNDLLVAVTEAVGNAITHGRAEEDGTIQIRWGIENQELLAVCIHARGEFSRDRQSAPEREDHGRGLAVMRLLVDDMAIESARDRTSVRLGKRFARRMELRL